MNDLQHQYEERFETVLKPLAGRTRDHISDVFDGVCRIDRITARAKSVERFMEKAATVIDEHPKYSDPLHQIQDQVGARIITYYLSDIARLSNLVERFYRNIEVRFIVPDSEWEFGYFGKHYVLLFPTEVIDKSIDRSLQPRFFELQLKTLFQHAWSEANHDLGYKPELVALKPEEMRLLAFTSAQAWGADRCFEELFHARNS